MTKRTPSTTAASPFFPSAPRAVVGTLAFHLASLSLGALLSLAALPARAEIPPALETAIRACATHDISFDDRLRQMTDAGGVVLEGDDRLATSQATLLGARLIDHAFTGDLPVETLPKALQGLMDTAAAEADLAADGRLIPALAFVALDGGTVSAKLYMISPERTECAIAGPAVTTDDISRIYPPAQGVTPKDNALGVVAAWSPLPDKPFYLIEGYFPNASVIAPVWSGAIPQSFFLFRSVPTTKAP